MVGTVLHHGLFEPHVNYIIVKSVFYEGCRIGYAPEALGICFVSVDKICRGIERKLLVPERGMLRVNYIGTGES